MKTNKFEMPPAALSRKCGNMLFVSGQVGLDEDHVPVSGNFVAEARQVFRNLSRTLQEQGFELSDVQHARAFLTDLVYFAEFNDVWKEFFTENPPARTTVGAELVAPFRIEIEAIAMREDSR